MDKQDKWDRRFLQLAETIAGWSKDPSTQVGAVIAAPGNRIVSLGFNGLPQFVEDHPSILENREEKYERVIHAEINAILFASQDLSMCTIYTWPFPPCSRCAAIIIQSGLTRVVAPCVTKRADLQERWQLAIKRSEDMFFQAGVEYDWKK